MQQAIALAPSSDPLASLKRGRVAEDAGGAKRVAVDPSAQAPAPQRSSGTSDGDESTSLVDISLANSYSSGFKFDASLSGFSGVVGPATTTVGEPTAPAAESSDAAADASSRSKSASLSSTETSKASNNQPSSSQSLRSRVYLPVGPAPGPLGAAEGVLSNDHQPQQSSSQLQTNGNSLLFYQMPFSGSFTNSLSPPDFSQVFMSQPGMSQLPPSQQTTDLFVQPHPVGMTATYVTVPNNGMGMGSVFPTPMLRAQYAPMEYAPMSAGLHFQPDFAAARGAQASAFSQEADALMKAGISPPASQQSVSGASTSSQSMSAFRPPPAPAPSAPAYLLSAANVSGMMALGGASAQLMQGFNPGSQTHLVAPATTMAAPPPSSNQVASPQRTATVPSSFPKATPSTLKKTPGANKPTAPRPASPPLAPGTELKKGSWSRTEDAALIALVASEASRGRDLLAITQATIDAVIPNRTVKQVRERWRSNLDPRIRRGEWSPEEDALIIELREKREDPVGWADIAAQLVGRTMHSVKTRYRSMQRAEKRPWAAKEDEALRLLANRKPGSINWDEVVRHLNNRTVEMARARYADLVNND